MALPDEASTLERRKQVRLRLRPGLSISGGPTPGGGNSDGGTFFIIKDPMSLRLPFIAK